MSDKEFGKLTRMKTHLYLVKMIQRKRIENGTGDDAGGSTNRDADAPFDGTEKEIDSAEAFFAAFPE